MLRGWDGCVLQKGIFPYVELQIHYRPTIMKGVLLQWCSDYYSGLTYRCSGTTTTRLGPLQRHKYNFMKKTTQNPCFLHFEFLNLEREISGNLHQFPVEFIDNGIIFFFYLLMDSYVLESRLLLLSEDFDMTPWWGRNPKLGKMIIIWSGLEFW